METQQASASNPVLRGRKVAVLMTDGVEQSEYIEPRRFLEARGAKVILVAPKAPGEAVQGFNHLDPGERFTVEMDLREARAAEFDALVLPGGVANPDALRLRADAIAFIADFGAANKPIAAICHGPWTLIDAGIASGRRMTSWPSLQNDLRNAGAQWSDEPVVVDGALVTSRKPADLPLFNDALLQALGGSNSATDAAAPETAYEAEPDDVSEEKHNVQDDPGSQTTG